MAIQSTPRESFNITPSDTTILRPNIGLLVVVAGDVSAEFREDQAGVTPTLGARAVGDVIVGDFRRVMAATTATVKGLV